MIIRISKSGLFSSNFFVISGESGFSGSWHYQSQYDRPVSAHLRRSSASNLHPDASRLLPAIRQFATLQKYAKDSWCRAWKFNQFVNWKEKPKKKSVTQKISSTNEENELEFYQKTARAKTKILTKNLMLPISNLVWSSCIGCRSTSLGLFWSFFTTVGAFLVKKLPTSELSASYTKLVGTSCIICYFVQSHILELMY